MCICTNKLRWSLCLFVYKMITKDPETKPCVLTSAKWNVVELVEPIFLGLLSEHIPALSWFQLEEWNTHSFSEGQLMWFRIPSEESLDDSSCGQSALMEEYLICWKPLLVKCCIWRHVSRKVIWRAWDVWILSNPCANTLCSVIRLYQHRGSLLIHCPPGGGNRLARQPRLKLPSASYPNSSVLPRKELLLSSACKLFLKMPSRQLSRGCQACFTAQYFESLT